MALRDGLKFLPKVALAPAVRNAAGTGATIDMAYYQSLNLVALVGAITDGTHSLTVKESDDGTTWSPVDPSQINGSFANLAANTPQSVAYVGYKRYVRVDSASSGTTGAAFSVVALLGHNMNLP